MRKLLAYVLGVCCSASAAFAVDPETQSPQQVPSVETSERLQFTEQIPHIFGDWGGLGTWLSSHGIDLGVSYLSESAWDVAGGMARGGTYAGQENLKLDVDWEKIADLNGFSTHIDLLSRQGRNMSTAYVGDVLFQAQEIYGSEAVEQALVHLAYFYLKQSLFNGNVDLRAGRLAVRNDFGTLPDACDFMSLTICADRALSTDLGWTVLPVANWGGMTEAKIYGPLSVKVGGYEVNPNDGGEYGFDWGLGGSSGVIIPAEVDWNIRLGIVSWLHSSHSVEGRGVTRPSGIPERAASSNDALARDRTIAPCLLPQANRAPAARCAGWPPAQSPGPSSTTTRHRQERQAPRNAARRPLARARRPRVANAAPAQSHASSR
jgi:hypothetical protein